MAPNTPPPDDAGTPKPLPASGLIDNLAALWAELRNIAHDHLQLAALEAQRALLSLVWIGVYGIVVGVLAAASWLAVAGAITLWLIDSGMGASSALVLGATLNLLGAFGFVWVIRRKSQALRFSATLGSLAPEDEGAASAPPQPESVSR